MQGVICCAGRRMRPSEPRALLADACSRTVAGCEFWHFQAGKVQADPGLRSQSWGQSHSAYNTLGVPLWLDLDSLSLDVVVIYPVTLRFQHWEPWDEAHPRLHQVLGSVGSLLRWHPTKHPLQRTRKPLGLKPPVSYCSTQHPLLHCPGTFLSGGLWSPPPSCISTDSVLLSHTRSQEPERKCSLLLLFLHWDLSLHSLCRPQFSLQILSGSWGSTSHLFFPKSLFWILNLGETDLPLLTNTAIFPEVLK